MRQLVSATVTAFTFGLAACAGSDPQTPAGGAGVASGGSATSAGAAGVNTAGTAPGGAGSSIGGVNGTGGSTAGTSNGGGAGANAGGASGGVGGNGGGAGSAGSADSGGSAGGAAYNPCPSNGACKLMPLGDSITDGCCGENTLSQGGSYRVELFRLSLTHNNQLTFVGSHSSGPNMVDGVTFPKKQEGHSGWTIADGGGRDGLQDQVEGWLKATPPDIITLMIGTNDVSIQLDLPNAPKRMGTLIDTITKTSPNALLVVAQMVPTKNDNDNTRVQAFNAALPAVVKTFTDTGKHVVLVDMYGAFTKNANYKTEYMNDKLHPKDAGYVAMANIWWAAVGPLLPAK